MNILFIGDIVAKAGRQAVSAVLPTIVAKNNIDLIIANGENATHGRGLSAKHYHALMDMGIEVFTLGNHFDDKTEIRTLIKNVNNIARPINLLENYPGVGTLVYTTKKGINVRVTNVLLTAFMNVPISSPYVELMSLVNKPEANMIHLIDIHGEATAEKQAFGWALDGKASAVVGTHTHVQTRDFRVLPKGTAYISDVGMCGCYNGIIGVERHSVMEKMWFDNSTHYEYDKPDDLLFCGVIIDVNEKTFKAESIVPVYEVVLKAHE